MVLDLATVVTVNAIVEFLAGIIFLAQALLHRHSRAARVWALAFFASILTTVCYYAWTISPEAWIGNALGNAAFAVGVGCLWLGAVRYNQRTTRIPVILVVTAGVVAFVASVFDVRDPWAGAPVLFLVLAILATIGAIETRRAILATHPYAGGLTIVLALTAVYCLARFVLFLAFGPESEVFTTAVSSANTGIMTIALSLVGVTTTAVLVSEEQVTATAGARLDRTSTFDSVLSGRSFERFVNGMNDRARRRGGAIAIVALVIPDLERIREAFGTVEAEALERDFRESALARIVPTAPIGESGPGRLVTVLPGASPAQAEQTARAIHRLVTEDLSRQDRAVVPLVGGGLAVGNSGAALIAAACAAAERSAVSEDAAVLLADDTNPS